MAGLLDGLVGDDTVKDEYGQTQADRRDPIWSGLIRAGLLAVAGGGRLMPEQRAQYIAQAGGALADIPKDMQAAASAAAQQKLRGQQLDEGKRKVADRDRIRQMMQTPEIADIVNNAKGADKIAIQAAVQTGDIGALNTAIGNLDKSGLNAEKLQVAKDRLELAKEKQDQNKGGYTGNAEFAQHLNNLKSKPIDSFEYWAAHQYFQTEHKNPDGSSVGKIDLTKFAEPTYVDPRTGSKPQPSGYTTPEEMRKTDAEIAQWSNPAAAPAPPKPPADPPPNAPMTPDVIQQIGKDMGVNQERVVNGVLIEKDAEGGLSWDTSTDTKEGRRYRLSPKTGIVSELPARKVPDAGQIKAFGENMTTIEKVDTVLADLKAHPEAVGFNGVFPDWFAQRKDPQGQRVRDLISDLSGVVIHDRSGSAVSVGEMKRLGFLPNATDTPAIVVQKLERMKKYVDDQTRGHYELVRQDYRVPPAVKQRYGRSGQPAAPAGGDKKKILKEISPGVWDWVEE